MPSRYVDLSQLLIVQNNPPAFVASQTKSSYVTNSRNKIHSLVATFPQDVVAAGQWILCRSVTPATAITDGGGQLPSERKKPSRVEVQNSSVHPLTGILGIAASSSLLLVNKVVDQLRDNTTWALNGCLALDRKANVALQKLMTFMFVCLPSSSSSLEDFGRQRTVDALRLTRR